MDLRTPWPYDTARPPQPLKLPRSHLGRFLVLEYVDGCELFQYLVQHGPLPSEQALNFFRQVIAGLDYCHKRLIW